MSDEATWSCPPGGSRRLTSGEQDLAHFVFGAAVDTRTVEIRRRKWFPLQPRATVMAPMGHIHFHPLGPHYRDDFANAPVSAQGLFIHEMVHVWQAQRRGRWWLPLMRHPFCRYEYTLKPGWPLDRYGIEQQAEIVRHAFLTRIGATPSATAEIAALESLLPF